MKAPSEINLRVNSVVFMNTWTWRAKHETASNIDTGGTFPGPNARSVGVSGLKATPSRLLYDSPHTLL